MQTVTISVRNLVEFVMRGGSIDSRYLSAKRMTEGIRIHQKIQRQRKKEAGVLGLTYESEVTLSHTCTYKDFEFVVEGRADGVARAADFCCVEEIKSTLQDPEVIELDPGHWHLAQAKCYAHFLCARENMRSVRVRLTYCNVETEAVKTFDYEFTPDELSDFFNGMLEIYNTFAAMDARRVAAREDTAKKFSFPFANYRKNQRAFSAAVYKTISQGKRLFAQAPTGTGKTISTLFPAIKALKADEKIFYLTAKTVTRAVAEDALFCMSQNGLVISAITLTAKDKICFCATNEGAGVCSPLSCPYADGHFDRVNAAILDMITNSALITRGVVTAFAEKHRVCPFEFQLDAAMFCDVIIADYNHVYDPNARLKRFFGDEKKLPVIVLHDEAHNLVDRSREMFSARLSSGDFVGFSAALRRHKTLLAAIKKIKSFFAETEEDLGEEMNSRRPVLRTDLPEKLQPLLREFVKHADKWLAENQDSAKHAGFMNLYFGVLDFLRVSEVFDRTYILFIEKFGRDIVLKQLCLDPSRQLAEVHERLRASVFFSATLSPMTYFRDVLGGREDDFGLVIPCPFPRDNLLVLVDDRVSTKYRDRDASYSKIAERIYAMISAKAGNYFAFFPSYEYLLNVFAVFTQKYPAARVKAQSRDMPEDEKSAFLSDFTEGSALLGFVVMGGIFSEGIDLPGGRLIGAAIVGVGLPLINRERDVMKEYYDEAAERRGYDYAYRFPGMNKVLQAAGRVIRTENDRGVLLLIDSRFTSSEYLELFPEEWRGFTRVRNKEEITSALEKFWYTNPPPVCYSIS